jgi:hypothetical protein
VTFWLNVGIGYLLLLGVGMAVCAFAGSGRGRGGEGGGGGGSDQREPPAPKPLGPTLAFDCQPLGSAFDRALLAGVSATAEPLSSSRDHGVCSGF